MPLPRGQDRRLSGLSSGASRRLVLVHAHPDDETLWTGPTMAKYAAEGAQVTLVTCTLGEEGEVIPPELRHLQSDADDALGPHRQGELAVAMAALGVVDHRLLAGGRWRDSGMAWVDSGVAGPATGRAHPDAFVNAPTSEAAAVLAEVLREVRPQVVVTYDPDGGYRHPDHIKAHQITTAATELVAQERESARFPLTTYWVREPRSWAEAGRAAALDDRLRPSSMAPPPAGAAYPSAVVDDDLVTAVVDGSAYLDRVRAALRAHATQVRVEGDWVALANGEGERFTGRDAFQRVAAPRGLPWSDDLFAVTDGSRR